MRAGLQVVAHLVRSALRCLRRLRMRLRKRLRMRRQRAQNDSPQNWDQTRLHEITFEEKVARCRLTSPSKTAADPRRNAVCLGRNHRVRFGGCLSPLNDTLDGHVAIRMLPVRPELRSPFSLRPQSPTSSVTVVRSRWCAGMSAAGAMLTPVVHQRTFRTRWPDGRRVRQLSENVFSCLPHVGAALQLQPVRMGVLVG